MRRILWLLAIVGATLGLLMSQTSGASVIDEKQPCQEEHRGGGKMTLPWSGVGKYVDGGNSDGGRHFDKKKKSAELSNDADQCNGTLYSRPENKPDAYIWQKNKNFNPQFTLVGSNYQYNKQRNNLWLDQSQHAPAKQFNVAGQSITDHGGPSGDAAWFNGGGAPLSNDADQENQRLTQEAENKPDAWIGQTNVNVNPQFTLVGDNTQNNKQQNNLWLDQSQHAPASQVNVAEQSIARGQAPPVDPANDADQSNGTLEQKAENKPDAWVGQTNVNVNPQFTLVGNNSQTNYQGNNASVDQSQDAGAIQGNLVGQSIQQG
jgi:hypothetical protein